LFNRAGVEGPARPRDAPARVGHMM
jgi:hypothetical protein